LRSERPGGCAGPEKPKFSDSDEAERGVCASMPYEWSRLETTRVGTANLERLVKNASRGVVSPSMPATFVIAW
jgi:hypothetical protein